MFENYSTRITIVNVNLNSDEKQNIVDGKQYTVDGKTNKKMNSIEI